MITGGDNDDRQRLLGAFKRGLEPTPDDQERNAAALALSLGAAMTSATSAAATKATKATLGKLLFGGSVKIKLAIAVLAVGGAGGAVYATTTTAATTTTTTTTTVAAPTATTASPPIKAVTAPASSETPVTVTAVVVTAPAPPPPSHHAQPPSVTLPPPPSTTASSLSLFPRDLGGSSGGGASSPPSISNPGASPPISPAMTEEVALVRSMNDAVAAHDPTRARALAAEHAKRFPNGKLAIEVEGLKLISACQAGATDRKVATDFTTRYPRAPIVDRVRSSCKLD